MEAGMAERFKHHGLELLGVERGWCHGVESDSFYTGKMPITGGFVTFKFRLDSRGMFAPDFTINGGRIRFLGWDWPDHIRQLQRCIPVFDDGWMMDGKGPFIPLHAYGETLDCLNKLLVAFGDQPFAERFVDINACIKRNME